MQMVLALFLPEIPPYARSTEEESQDNNRETGKLDIYYLLDIINDE